MIIFGSRATHLKTEQLRNAVCPHCDTRGQMTASVYGRHAHVFWIPFFPMGNTGVLECQHCHKGFKPKDLPEKARMEYKNFRSTVRTPIWKFAGLGLVALLMSWAWYSSKATEEKVAQLVDSPMMFDTYTIKTEANYFTLFKVVEVFQDSIYVNYNQYETNKRTGLDDIDIEKNYGDDIYSLSNADLKVMLESGIIEDIERKK